MIIPFKKDSLEDEVVIAFRLTSEAKEREEARIRQRLNQIPKQEQRHYLVNQANYLLKLGGYDEK